MEIVYRADGHQTMTISGRLPRKGEPLEDVVKEFEPVAFWEEQAAEFNLPEVGATGFVGTEIIVPIETEPVSDIPITVVGA